MLAAAVASTCPAARLCGVAARSTVRPHQTPAARFGRRLTQTTWTPPTVDFFFFFARAVLDCCLETSRAENMARV